MKFRNVFVAVAVVACFGLHVQTAFAQSNGSSTNNLFAQYTTRGAGDTAGLYPAPHPVPHWVGASSYTYQPLMPHEMMYAHQRNYYNYYGNGSYYDNCYGHGGGGGLTKTTVVWQNGCSHMGPLPGSGRFAEWQYAWQRYLYCIESGGSNCGSFLHGGGGGGFGSRLHGHGFGCTSGSCDTGGYYGGEVYGGSYGNAGGGCASCAQNDGDTFSR
ncbi:MAG: hypothetical protein AAF456_13450 [Planctomycetota bacterium]